MLKQILVILINYNHQKKILKIVIENNNLNLIGYMKEKRKHLNKTYLDKK